MLPSQPQPTDCSTAYSLRSSQDLHHYGGTLLRNLQDQRKLLLHCLTQKRTPTILWRRWSSPQPQCYGCGSPYIIHNQMHLLLHLKRNGTETRTASPETQPNGASLECEWYIEHIRNCQAQDQHQIELWRSMRVLQPLHPQLWKRWSHLRTSLAPGY